MSRWRGNGLRWGDACAPPVRASFISSYPDDGVTCAMSRSANVRDNAALESFFSSMKTERTGASHIERAIEKQARIA